MNKGIQLKVTLDESLGLSSLVDDGLVDALRLPEELHRFGSLKAHQREVLAEEQQVKARARDQRKLESSSPSLKKDLAKTSSSIERTSKKSKSTKKKNQSDQSPKPKAPAANKGKPGQPHHHHHAAAKPQLPEIEEEKANGD